jgi:hypothetical protein
MPIEVRDQVRSIVVASASHVGSDGTIGPSPILPGSVPIDVAESADGERLAFVMAGEDDVMVANEDYVRHAVRIGVGGEGMFSPQLLSRTHLSGPVAVAWAGDRLVVQFRSPAAIAVFRPEEPDKPVEDERFVLLGDPLPADPGHEAFHASTGLGLACASCHPEGAEDGRVWQFEEGRRRTQPLYGGVLSTAPFHWGGELVSLDTIIDEVFVTRMGGSLADMDREGLATWLDGIPAPVGMEAGEPASIEHGRELFAARGCDSCHSGPHFTDNRSHYVGTGGRMQTPMLLGLGERAPYLHDGCAQELGDRFDRCHTPGHGNVAALSTADVDDLVDYLRTL